LNLAWSNKFLKDLPILSGANEVLHLGQGSFRSTIPFAHSLQKPSSHSLLLH